MFTFKNYTYKNFYAIHVYMHLCNDQLCVIKFRSKIQGYQMSKLPEHLKEEENSTENMVNNSVQKRKVAFRTP